MNAYEAIVACDGDRDRAAELLGVSRRTLYRSLTAEDKQKLLGDGLSQPHLSGATSKAMSWIRVHGHPSDLPSGPRRAASKEGGWKALCLHLYGDTERSSMQRTYMIVRKIYR